MHGRGRKIGFPSPKRHFLIFGNNWWRRFLLFAFGKTPIANVIDPVIPLVKAVRWKFEELVGRIKVTVHFIPIYDVAKKI